jgi:hypothetical protein
MSRPIYVDLDATLIDSAVDRYGNVTKIVPRPGGPAFIEKLSRHGDLFLLTHAMRPHVANAFREIGPSVELFQGVISREDMASVIEQVEYLVGNQSLTDEERTMLYQEIPPLAPRGFIFDDQPIGSELYLIKSAAVGSRPRDWIQVKPFRRSNRDKDRELERAYQEYRRRMTGAHTVMAGRAWRVVG